MLKIYCEHFSLLWLVCAHLLWSAQCDSTLAWVSKSQTHILRGKKNIREKCCPLEKNVAGTHSDIITLVISHCLKVIKTKILWSKLMYSICIYAWNYFSVCFFFKFYFHVSWSLSLKLCSILTPSLFSMKIFFFSRKCFLYIVC